MSGADLHEELFRARAFESDEAADKGRQLFRYMGGEEWREYRAVLRGVCRYFVRRVHS